MKGRKTLSVRIDAELANAIAELFKEAIEASDYPLSPELDQCWSEFQQSIRSAKAKAKAKMGLIGKACRK